MHRIPLTSISMAEATLRVEQEHKAPQWEDQRQREFEEALPILTVATKFCIYGAISRFLHLSYVEWRRGRREREREGLRIWRVRSDKSLTGSSQDFPQKSVCLGRCVANYSQLRGNRFPPFVNRVDFGFGWPKISTSILPSMWRVFNG